MMLYVGPSAVLPLVCASDQSTLVEYGMEKYDAFSIMPRRLGAPSLTFKGDNPVVILNECEGDCDSDSDCADGLVCLQRDGNSPATVPGCSGTSPSKVRISTC